jgi:folate-binding protein YgfZ
MMERINLNAYRAAREAAAIAELSGWGWLRLTGRDRLDLPHRLSTNAVKNLASGAGAVTVITSPTGRVMAAVTVYAGADEAHLHAMPPQGAGVARYLNSMIFWQDQVEVKDLTAEVCQFAAYGPEAQAALERRTGAALAGVPETGWRAGTLAETPVTLHRGGPLEPWAWTLVAPSAAADAIRGALAGLPQLDAATADLLRIEAGLPLWGRELSEEVTPLETGLLPAISFNKGCYTGQEVIARQTNYDKVTRNLVGLAFAEGEAAVAGEEGWRVLGPGRGGFVGSAAYSPALGRVIALAVAPRELAAPGTEVEIERGDQRLKATVRSLPFEMAR